MTRTNHHKSSDSADRWATNSSFTVSFFVRSLWVYEMLVFVKKKIKKNITKPFSLEMRLKIPLLGPGIDIVKF
jgi:hypothetical protein